MKIKRKNIILKLLIISIVFIFSFSITLPGVYADSKDNGVKLFDDYNRTDLGLPVVNGVVYPGEAVITNSQGITIYWINYRDVKPELENNAIKLTMGANGWFGEGVASKDPQYKYIIMKIKGEIGGEEKSLAINPDAKGLINFTDLKGPDGKPVPPITKDYQNFVIDIAKSGFNLPYGFEAMHFNNTKPVTIFIDEIYVSKDGIPKDIAKYLADEKASAESAAVEENSGDGGSISTSDGTSVGEDVQAVETAEAAEAATVDSAGGAADSGLTDRSSGNKAVWVGVITLSMVLAIAGIIYNSFIRKPASK